MSALVVIAGSVFGVVIGRPALAGGSWLARCYFLISALSGWDWIACAVLYVWFDAERKPRNTLQSIARRLGKLLLAFLVINLLVSLLSDIRSIYVSLASPRKRPALYLSAIWAVLVGLLDLHTWDLECCPANHPVTNADADCAPHRRWPAGLLIATYIAVPLNIVIPA
ncbi:MAG: hypothetical protein MZV65_35910 [Chromatiales bacterium]|nr:hypothetical protein [Chromatiales bacterium]